MLSARRARLSGGESGIRTRGRFNPTHAFQACDLNHSSISPGGASIATGSWSDVASAPRRLASGRAAAAARRRAALAIACTAQTSRMHLPSPNQLDPTDAAEVALFADALSITSEALLEIVAKVGPMRPAIRFYALRGAKETKRGKTRDASLRKPQSASAPIDTPTVQTAYAVRGLDPHRVRSPDRLTVARSAMTS